MIRNYYTEAYKGGIVPTISGTQLIDGTVKITESTTATSVTNTQPSVNFSFNFKYSYKKRYVYYMPYNDFYYRYKR